jgi:TonB family protein
MSRIHKKCLAGSAGLHVLLLAALFATPAFLQRPEPIPNFAAMNFVSSDSIRRAFAAPAAPTPAPTAPSETRTEPPAPKPTPPAPKPEVRPPPVETAKLTKPEIKVNPELKKVESREIAKNRAEPDSEDPATSATTTKPVKTQRKEIRTSYLQPKGSPEDDRKARKQREVEADERERQGTKEWLARERSRQEGLQERARRFAATADQLRSRAVSSTDIGVAATPGDDAFASWYAQLKTVYERAWEGRRPGSVTTDLTLVKAVVTIARDGTVQAFQVLEPSGIPAVDASVNRVLREMRKVPPFPSGANEKERKVVINFKVEG